MPTARMSEPVLALAVVSNALSLVVTLNIGLTAKEAGLWVAVITAFFGLCAALVVRPISPVAFSTMITAVGDLLAGYHYQVSPGVLSAISAVVLSVLMLVARGHVSPLPAPAAELQAV